MAPRAWMLAGVLASSPLSARAAQLDARAGDPASERAPAEVAGESAGEAPGDAGEGRLGPTRLEVGVQLGDYLLATGSPTQLRYAPALSLRLAWGLPRIQGLGFVRLVAPIDFAGSIAAEQRQFSTGGGLGLRSIFVQRRWIRFGLWLAGTVNRLDSHTVLPALPGLDEGEHVQDRVTHHAGLELGLELGVPLPVRRGPTTVLSLGAALAFVFPIGSKRSGTDVDPTRYGADELGVIAVAGGATALLELGVILGWELAGDRNGGR